MRRLYHVLPYIIKDTIYLFFTERQCGDCKEFKVFDEFSYDKAQVDGYHGRCKKCTSEKWNSASGEEKDRRKAVRKASEDLRREEIQAHDRERSKTPEFHAQRNARHRKKREAILLERELNPLPPKPIPTTKICPKCDPPVEKSLDEFPKNGRNANGHGSYCLECLGKYTRSEEAKAKARAYRREKMQTDPEFAKRRREYQNQWRKEHPLSQRELTLRRNARKKAARTERVSFKKILERDGRFCYICHKPITLKEKLDFDHVIPLSRGGAHSMENIKPSHGKCNRSKGNKLLEEMFPGELFPAAFRGIS